MTRPEEETANVNELLRLLAHARDQKGAMQIALDAAMERLEKQQKALRYIIDHDWVAGATPGALRRWMNEFVEVARNGLGEKEGPL